MEPAAVRAEMRAAARLSSCSKYLGNPQARKDHDDNYCTADNRETSLYLHCSLLISLWAVAHAKNRITTEC
jgi:hypothetical protein